MKISLKEMTRISLSIGIIIVLAQISIPMFTSVPITLQTFAIAFVAVVLGAKLGVMATGIYVLLGAIGIPVFASLKGGFQVLMGYTGGFLWGFLFMALFCGLGSILFSKRKAYGYQIVGVLIGFMGLVICHIFGALQYSIIAEITFSKSMWLVSFPYILKDIISVVVAFYIGREVKKRLG